MLRGIFGSVGLFLLASSAFARPPQLLQPSGAWVPLKSEHSCKLSRAFGEGKNRVVAILERPGPGYDMKMMVFGPGLRSGPAGWNAQSSFLPNAAHVFKDGLSARTARGDTAIQWAAVDFAPDRALTAPIRTVKDYADFIGARRDDETKAAAAVTGISISEPGGNRVVLQSGSMNEVHRTLDECGRAMLRGWGLDPVAHDRIVIRAASKRNPNDLFDSRDYPVLAARYGGEAIITARLMVDAAGAVTKCTAISDFAEPEMEQLICRNLGRAVFQPAMTADGEAAPDYALLTFRFGMEP